MSSAQTRRSEALTPSPYHAAMVRSRATDCERRLRADLGFEVDEKLTLRHLAAHVTTAQHARLREAYEAALRQGVEADAP
jgi:hypothetical protein